MSYRLLEIHVLLNIRNIHPFNCFVIPLLSLLAPIFFSSFLSPFPLFSLSLLSLILLLSLFLMYLSSPLYVLPPLFHTCDLSPSLPAVQRWNLFSWHAIREKAYLLLRTQGSRDWAAITFCMNECSVNNINPQCNWPPLSVCHRTDQSTPVISSRSMSHKQSPQWKRLIQESYGTFSCVI